MMLISSGSVPIFAFYQTLCYLASSVFHPAERVPKNLQVAIIAFCGFTNRGNEGPGLKAGNKDNIPRMFSRKVQPRLPAY